MCEIEAIRDAEYDDVSHLFKVGTAAYRDAIYVRDTLLRALDEANELNKFERETSDVLMRKNAQLKAQLDEANEENRKEAHRADQYYDRLKEANGKLDRLLWIREGLEEENAQLKAQLDDAQKAEAEVWAHFIKNPSTLQYDGFREWAEQNTTCEWDDVSADDASSIVAGLWIERCQLKARVEELEKRLGLDKSTKDWEQLPKHLR